MTVVYPTVTIEGKLLVDEDLIEARKALHCLLCLPTNRPFFRLINKDYFTEPSSSECVCVCVCVCVCEFIVCC